MNEQTHPAISPRFAEIFTRDANKAIAALEVICNKQGAYEESELRTYLISVHGMRSALAGIGRPELSAVAFNLEQAARDGKTDVIMLQTQSFIDSLRMLVEELAPKKKETDGEAGKAEEDNKPYLREKLLKIKAACEAYDKKTAKTLVAELREKTWTQPTNELLGAIEELLLHSDFDNAAGALNKFIQGNAE